MTCFMCYLKITKACYLIVDLVTDSPGSSNYLMIFPGSDLIDSPAWVEYRLSSLPFGIVSRNLGCSYRKTFLNRRVNRGSVLPTFIDLLGSSSRTPSPAPCQQLQPCPTWCRLRLLHSSHPAVISCVCCLAWAPPVTHGTLEVCLLY